MKLESMTSASTSMSVSDVSGWQFISHLSKQRLMVRLSSAQCIEANHLVCDVYFTPYQPMNPRSVYFELTAKDADDSFIVGAANVDNTPAELCLRVELPPTWKRDAWALHPFVPRSALDMPQRICPTAPAMPRSLHGGSAPRPLPAIAH